MMRRLVCWFCLMMLPAGALAGSPGSLERQAAVSSGLGDQVQEFEREATFYRHEGSLWEQRSSAFYMDNKARNVNDIVTIRIAEISNASQQVSTKTSRDTNILASITKFLGSPLDFGMDNLWGSDDEGNKQPFVPEIESSAQSSHSGKGEISGKGELSASVAARVLEVLPNGNLLVEGRKEVTIDNEKRFIKLSGMVRPQDIEFDNTIASTKIADARIEYVGSGIISDKQKPGVFHRVFDWIYPL